MSLAPEREVFCTVLSALSPRLPVGKLQSSRITATPAVGTDEATAALLSLPYLAFDLRRDCTTPRFNQGLGRMMLPLAWSLSQRRLLLEGLLE